MVKCLAAMRETWVRSLGWEDLLEKEMATHFSILAWKIPWTESLLGYSPWGHKESDTTERLSFFVFFLVTSNAPAEKQLIKHCEKTQSHSITKRK